MLPPRIAGCAGSAARIACDQRRRGGLALGPRHADRRRGAQAQEQIDLRDEGRGSRSPAARRSTRSREHGAKARLGRREVGVDRRARWRPVPRRRSPTAGRPRGRAASVTARPSSCRDGPLQLRSRSRVIDASRGARIGQEARQRDAAASEPEDGHGPAARGRPRRSLPASACRGRSGAVIVVTGSRWIEARKSVMPRSPARTATIQKRSVIFSSSQPPSSKW